MGLEVDHLQKHSAITSKNTVKPVRWVDRQDMTTNCFDINVKHQTRNKAKILEDKKDDIHEEDCRH